jgi:hypothetical protein
MKKYTTNMQAKGLRPLMPIGFAFCMGDRLSVETATLALTPQRRTPMIHTRT